MPSALPYTLPLLQLAGGVAALFALAFAPPDRGNLLYVPLTRHAQPVQAAISGGFALLGRGPLGSVVVRGDHPHDAAALLRAGILVTAAPSVLCGASVPA